MAKVLEGFHVIWKEPQKLFPGANISKRLGYVLVPGVFHEIVATHSIKVSYNWCWLLF